MLKQLFICLFVLSGILAFGQAPANDSVANPFDFGPLPNPNGCPISNFGTPVFATGTLLNAKKETLKPSILNCHDIPSNSTSQNAPDVWYKFEASGDFIKINIKPSGNNPNISKPNVTLFEFQGSILTLLPLECHIGSNDTCNLIFKGITPGKFYYLQVSSSSMTDVGNFLITLENRYQCNDCLQRAELHTYPPPVNGFYETGQVVTFVYNVNGYKQYQLDAFKAIAISIGSGWDTLGVAASANASFPVSGIGVWKWKPVIVNSIVSPGFKYLAPSAPFGAGDGPSDEFDSWTFTWKMRVKSCSPGPQPLNLKMNNISEKEYANLISPCNLDEDFYFKAVPNCCNNIVTSQPFPIFSAPPCFSNCNGVIIIPPPANPFSSWATLITSNGNIFQDDIYTTTVPFAQDSAIFTNACSGWNNIILPAPSFGCALLYQDTLQGKDLSSYTLFQSSAQCGNTCNNSAYLYIPNLQPGYTANITWFDPINLTVPFETGPAPDSVFCANTSYQVHIQVLNSAGNAVCPDIIDNIQIYGYPKSDPYVSYPSNLCTYGTSYSPYIASPGGLFTQIYPLTTSIVDQNNGTILSGAIPNSYTIQYITPGQCPDTSLSYISIDSLFNASFSYPKNEICTTEPVMTPVVNAFVGGVFYFLPNGLVIDTMTGTINPALSDTGNYNITYYTNTGSPCDNTFTVPVKIKPACETHIYNSFSPNSDNLNDYWHIDGIAEKKTYVAVYNRWGAKVWDVNNYNNRDKKFEGNDWRGTPLSEGTYYYIITYIDDNKIDKHWLEITK